MRTLHWLNLPTGLLIALLQRTPVLRVIVAAEEVLVASRAGLLLKSLLPTAAALGAVQTLAGATQFIQTPASPVTGTVGQSLSVTFTYTGAPTPVRSWRLLSSLPPGLTIPGLSNSIVNLATPVISGLPTQAGTYAVTVQGFDGLNATGETKRGGETITFNIVGGAVSRPTIITPPATQAVNPGATVTFSVAANAGGGTLGFQWRKLAPDGSAAAIPGATGASYTIVRAQASDMGFYQVTVSNTAGSVLSDIATLAVTTGAASSISNLSVRTTFTGGGNPLIVGFVTSGAKNLLIRAVGPSLKTVFGLTNFFADPQFAVLNDAGTVALNDAWNPGLSPTFTSLGAFPLDNRSADAALLLPIDGPHTVQVNGTGAGVMLVEVYDAQAGSTSRLKNVSARNPVGTGDNILIGGFVVDGEGPRTVLIRGIGPALRDVFGVSGQLVDPKLELYVTINGVSTRIAENDDWSSSLTAVFDQLGAYRFTGGSKDAALLITLPPGVYTAQVSGVNGTTGDGVVEVYELP